MNRTAIIGFATVVCLSVAAGNNATSASELRATDKSVTSKADTDSKPVRQAQKAARRDPMQASASYSSGSVARQDVTSHRYDGGCMARHGAGSSEYGACLQNIPAAALVGGGGFR